MNRGFGLSDRHHLHEDSVVTASVTGELAICGETAVEAFNES